MQKILWILCSILCVASWSPALKAEEKAADLGELASTVVVPDTLKLEDIQRSIIEAAIGRGWTIRSREDAKVVLFLENGRWVSTLTLTYDTKAVQIYSKSTRNGKPKLPEDWVNFLKKDITKNLNTKAYLKP